MTTMTTFTVVFVVVLFIFLKTVIIVPMRHGIIIERLGKFRVVLEPGMHILVPFFDRVAYRHEMREQVLDIPSQSCITRDNIQVEVDGLVYLKIMDPRLASYGIGNYRLASVNLAQTTMRSEIGKLALGETFSERDQLNETIVKEIDKASDPWGIKVLRYEIKNIHPSRGVVHTLEKQMEAEREKRAEITKAQAEKAYRINISMGERQEAINLSEGEKQRRINVAKGRAEEISILAEATAKGIELVAEAIKSPGGNVAVKMRLLEAYVDELGKILDTANVSVLPADLARVRAVFEGVSGVATASTRQSTSQGEGFFTTD